VTAMGPVLKILHDSGPGSHVWQALVAQMGYEIYLLI
jgi:hypothetical protein